MKNEKPSIVLGDGTKITVPRKPRMKDWRAIAKYDEDFSKDDNDASWNEALERQTEILADFYGKENVENMDLDGIIPAFKEIAAWVMKTVFARLQNIEGDAKNAETAKE